MSVHLLTDNEFQVIAYIDSIYIHTLPPSSVLLSSIYVSKGSESKSVDVQKKMVCTCISMMHANVTAICLQHRKQHGYVDFIQDHGRCTYVCIY